MNILYWLGLIFWSSCLAIAIVTRKPVSWWLYALAVSVIILFYIGGK